MRYSQKIFNSIKLNYLNIGLYTSILLALLIYKFPTFGTPSFSDSPAYINNSIIAGGLYPLIIDILQFIFGSDNFRWICATQFVISYTILFLAFIGIFDLIKVQNELKIFFFLVFAVFMKMLMQIMTEAFAYPLFFVVVLYLMRTIYFRQIRYLYISMLAVTLLCLIRSQFIFFYPLLLLLILWLIYIDKQKWLKLRLFAVLFAALVITLFFSNTVNYITRGKFIAPQGSGIILAVAPSYFAVEQDADSFGDPLTKKIFTEYLAKLKEMNAVKHCDEKKWKKPDEQEVMGILAAFPNWDISSGERWYKDMLEKYEDSIAGEFNHARAEGDECIYRDVTALGNSDLYFVYAMLYVFNDNGITDWERINPIASEIGITLREDHFKEWLCMYLSMLYDNFLGLAMIVIYLVILLSYAISIKKKKFILQPVDIFILLTLVLHFVNTAFVTSIAMVHDRYFFYTFLMLFCSFIMFLDRVRVNRIRSRK